VEVGRNTDEGVSDSAIPYGVEADLGNVRDGGNEWCRFVAARIVTFGLT
jgi:hypothetical protein